MQLYIFLAILTTEKTGSFLKLSTPSKCEKTAPFRAVSLSYIIHLNYLFVNQNACPFITFMIFHGLFRDILIQG